MHELLFQLALVAVLIVLNAGIAGSELALISLREGQLQRLEQQHEAGRILARLARDPNRVTLGLTFVMLVFGELAPKRVAMQRAERWGLMAARPLAAVARLARPVIWLLGVSTDLVVQLVGGDPSRRREAVTEEELRDLVASQTAFSPEQLTGSCS